MVNSHDHVSSVISQQGKYNSKVMECPICQEKATKLCSSCKCVAYCCVDHQKLDWRNHKKVCQPFSIKKTEDMGMGWVATRDIKAGVTLLEESPVIQAPAWNWKTSFPVEGFPKKCLTCAIRIHNARCCSTCRWPVCSEKCEKNPVHMNNECKEFVSRKVKYPPPPGWQAGVLVICIRANIMKTREPKKFADLMALRDVYNNHSTNEKLQETDIPVGMMKVLKGPNCLSRNELRKLLRICKVNGFESEFAPPKSHLGDGTADDTLVVYLKVSRLNHSCSPNCSVVSGSAPSNKIKICTAVPINRGEPLTINYFEFLAFESTTHRQQHISTAGFICKCKRCLDPSELGTFLSGIKCFSCSGHLKAGSDDDKVGFLLIKKPLDFVSDPDPAFECHRCRRLISMSKVFDLVLPQEAKEAFQNVNQWTNPKAIDMKSLEDFLTQCEEGGDVKDHFHRNHFVIQRAMRLVMTIQKNDLDKMTIEDLKKRIRRLKFLLTIDDKLFPGLYKPRYQDLKWLKSALLCLINKFGRKMPSKEVEEFRQELDMVEREGLLCQHLDHS